MCVCVCACAVISSQIALHRNLPPAQKQKNNTAVRCDKERITSVLKLPDISTRNARVHAVGDTVQRREHLILMCTLHY